jgi:hypothetical protein
MCAAASMLHCSIRYSWQPVHNTGVLLSMFVDLTGKHCVHVIKALLQLQHDAHGAINTAAPTHCKLLQHCWLKSLLTCWYGSRNQEDSLVAREKSTPVYTACPATNTRCCKVGAG